MAIKIGIFKMQQQALDAVKGLEQEGFSKTELKVIAKDREHSRRLESETDVHTDEIQELADTREHMEDGLGIPAIGV
ncbi:general stress protein, partial [Paenibacillus sepulcri]|nr:general stress protein [Paenibacillus sepulcri]